MAKRHHQAVPTSIPRCPVKSMGVELLRWFCRMVTTKEQGPLVSKSHFGFLSLRNRVSLHQLWPKNFPTAWTPFKPAGYLSVASWYMVIQWYTIHSSIDHLRQLQLIPYSITSRNNKRTTTTTGNYAESTPGKLNQPNQSSLVHLTG